MTDPSSLPFQDSQQPQDTPHNTTHQQYSTQPSHLAPTTISYGTHQFSHQQHSPSPETKSVYTDPVSSTAAVLPVPPGIPAAHPCLAEQALDTSGWSTGPCQLQPHGQFRASGQPGNYYGAGFQPLPFSQTAMAAEALQRETGIAQTHQHAGAVPHFASISVPQQT